MISGLRRAARDSKQCGNVDQAMSEQDGHRSEQNPQRNGRVSPTTVSLSGHETDAESCYRSESGYSAASAGLHAIEIRLVPARS